MAQTVSQPRPAAVAAVLARASQWTSARRKSDGHSFYFVPGNRPGAVYMTDAQHCTCPDARERGRVCKHSLAVQQHQARQQPATSEYGPCKTRGCIAQATGKARRCDAHFAELVAALGIAE